MDSHAVVRNNTESSCESFTQCPPVVASYSILTGTDIDIIKVQNISIKRQLSDKDCNTQLRVRRVCGLAPSSYRRHDGGRVARLAP